MTPQLTFCSNLFASQGWDDHFAILQTEIPKLNDLVGKVSLLGLRLSAQDVKTLTEVGKQHAFKEWLSQVGLTVPIVNGFPYGDFHGTVVKDKVHQPDWTTDERLSYTCAIADMLVDLLPVDITVAGISTSPISYAPWFRDEPMKQWETLVMGARKVGEWVVFAARLNQRTNKIISLELEPEPDGLIDDIANTISFFDEYLWVYGKEVVMSALGCDDEEALRLLKRHVAICFDVCHFAVLKQPITKAFVAFEQAGISIGRVQLSAAIIATDLAGLIALTPFDEPTYLHQAAVTLNNGRQKRFQDLGPALSWCQANPDQWDELRTHYHVPIYAESFGALTSTQPEVKEAIAYVKANMPATILEVETYTWGILPQDLQMPVADSIASELNWVKAIWDAN